jgi:hypothetical protein
MAFYIAWKESTSTSPSGRHLGHYKAIINDPERKKEACNENYMSKHKLDLLELYTNLVNIPLKYGFALEKMLVHLHHHYA